MNRNILQDIKPLTSTSRKHVYEPVDDHDVQEVVREAPPRRRIPDERPYSTPRKPRRGIWMIAIAVVLILIGSLSYLFAGATVTINPKSQAVSLDDDFLAKSGAGDNELGFEIIALSDTATAEVAATGTKSVERKATGTVILYNENASSQPLAIETRLADKDGKIFKTDKALTIPAAKTVAGKKVPGSIEADVHADKAGSEYNIPLSDFTVVGFKGTAKYKTVYGRSKTPMTGGATGTEANISDEDRAKTIETLSASLKEKLLSKANAQIPVDFLYYSDGIFFSPAKDLKLIETKDGKATVELSGDIAVILFNEDRLAKHLSKKASEYDGADVTFHNLKNLEFTLKNKEIFVPKETKSITFHMKGDGIVIWDIDPAPVLDALAGKKKKEFNDIIGTFSAVKSAEVLIQPLWKGVFPADKNDITVNITDPSAQ